MKYLSVCAGIEAASVAWHPLGWEAVGYSEIEPFPSAVLKHHYPDVTNYGDMTKYKEWNLESIDLLVGGTPCQSFSVAGLRKGLTDPRGNLALVYCGILDHFRPQWFVWENVPGVLSSNGGRDFGSFLGALAELGYGFAYRVLDAQYFGVAQRRRRVFVVGYLGDWRPAAEVLFERESVRGDSAPSRDAGEKTASDVARCFDRQSSGEYGISPVASTMSARDYKSASDLVAQPMAYDVTFCDANGRRKDRPNGGLYVNETDASKTITAGGDISTYIAQPITFSGQMSVPQTDVDMSATLQAKNPMAVAFTCSDQANSFAWERPFSPTITAQQPSDTSNIQTGVRIGMAVRRLTPVECERLQGFPDNYTNIPWRKTIESPDSPRYKALGNSMAVPVMAWIGQRIANYEQQA
jgi:DNA (cytosine-5)-methyltransferase 1